MANLQKKRKEFSFLFPLTQKVVSDLRIVTQHSGDLHVSGVGYFNPNESQLESERYDVDIDSVMWNGTDIKVVLEVVGYMETIEEVALEHVSGLFEDVIPVVRIIEPINYSAI